MNAADPLNSSTSDKPSENPAKRVVGMVLGGVVGYYCGFMLLLPLGGVFLGFWLLKQLATDESRPLLPAAAVVFGHLAWMLVGVAFTHAIAPVAMDVIILFGGLLWLVFRPGRGPVLLLGLYTLVALFFNVSLILQADWGTATHKALTAHIALRACLLWLLVTGCLKLEKLRSAIVAEPVAAGDQPPLPPVQ